MPDMTREEHLTWYKQCALLYIDSGDLRECRCLDDKRSEKASRHTRRRKYPRTARSQVCHRGQQLSAQCPLGSEQVDTR